MCLYDVLLLKGWKDQPAPCLEPSLYSWLTVLCEYDNVLCIGYGIFYNQVIN